MEYEEVTDVFGNTMIKATLKDGLILWIPSDPQNQDYQKYLTKKEAMEQK